MSRRQVPFGVVLVAILAACSAGAAPTAPLAQPTTNPDATVPLASLTPMPTTGTASPSPTASRTPATTPAPTASPAPPKPTGVKLDSESESICDTGPEGLCEVSGFRYTVTWKAPRATGVEIRVYGVTRCFSDDTSGAIIDGWCLREHTALPKSELVLLAKAPASKGKVTWRLNEFGVLDGHTVGDAYYPGDPFYSVVLAAYGADGQHSVFAIADVTHLCYVIESLDCPDDPFWPGSEE